MTFYRLTVIPGAPSDQGQQGRIEHVLIRAIAPDGTESHQWWTGDSEQLLQLFSRIFPKLAAMGIAEMLRKGNSITLSETFTSDQLITLGFREDLLEHI